MKKLLRLISVATMLLAATTFMACSSDDDDGPSESSSATRVGSGAFVGVVLDNTGKPVEGATVTLGNKTATTNKGGEFKLEGVAVNDPVVRSIQTTVSTATGITVTNGDEKLEPKDSTTTSERKYAYTLTVTKDGYIPGTVDSMYVSEAEDIGGIEDARLSALKNQYAGILNAYAGAVGTGSITGSSSGDGYFLTGNAPEDKSATMTSVAAALKEIQNLYAHLGKTYSSTFVECKSLVPLNASLSGKLKLNPSPATAEVYNETTYPAPKDTVVTVAYTHEKNSAPYTFKTKTDAEGNFKFEKLPSGVALSIEVEGFTAKAGDVEAYFSTDGGLNAYRANFEEILNNGAYYNDATTVVKTITIDGNSLNVSGVDIMLFAQLEKIWVTATNLIKNNEAALIKPTDAFEFTFNKAVQRVALTGSNLQDVNDSNYTVTIDSTDAKKVKVTPNDGVWTATSTTNNDPTKVKLVVLAADGTKELVNDSFPFYLDDKVWVSITESSKKDKLLSLTAPVVLTFSKPMRTVAVTAGSLTSDYTKDWTENNTVLTLTPKKYWDTVSDNNGEVTFTVTGVAEDETTTIKYWKTNSGNGGTGTAAFTGLKVYFDNIIDVAVAKVSDTKFTATFSKALKEIPALDLNKAAYFTIKYYATPSATSGTDVTTKVKLSLADKVLTVEPKNSEFEDYGYYEVTLGASVVGATGETQFRELGKATASTTKAFKADFALGAEFKETTVEIVTTLPATAVASRALYADAASYVKITFTKDIAKSALKLADTVTNYIDGKSVYLPLAKNNDESDVEITGTVTAKSGETKEWGTTANPNKLTTGYKVSKNTYKMVASSLYTHKASIAGGTNDATVQKIKPTDSITFTFDQDVTAATWTAELYDQYNVGKKDLEQTLYKVTATAAGKVVTVALAEGSKALVNAEKYYLSLKAVTGAGDAEIVRYDSNAFAVYKTDGTTIDPTNYGYVDGGTSATVGTKIINSSIVSTKKYIEINTEAVDAKYENLYVVKAGKNSATTDFTDFAKTISSSIVLEFNEDVTGFTAVLANELPTSGWETKDDVVLSKTYASTATVSGKIITIAPTYAFPSKSTVYPIVFNAEGKRVKLVDVAKAEFLSSTAADKKQYVSKEFDSTKPVELDKVIQGAVASTAYDLALTPITTAKIANEQNLTFTFKPFLTQTGSTASYGTYTLYRKVKDAVSSAEQWKEAGKYKIQPTTSEVNAGWAAIDYVKENKAAGEKATVEDFTILKRTACISVKIGDGEFNYDDTSNYKLVGENDNVMIVSAAKEIKATEVVITSSTNYPTGLNKPSDTSTEAALSDGSNNVTFTISTTAYLDETKTFANAEITGVPTATTNRINKAGKLTYKVNGKNLQVSVDKDAVAAKGDKIVIELTDVIGKKASWTIILTD